MTALASPVPEPVAGAVAPPISRDIYGMPSFATLAAADVDATVAWYTEGLGFIVLFTIPGPGGAPVLVHLRRWQFQDLLVRPATGPVTAGNAVTLTFAAVADELDGLSERARAHGGGSAGEPVDTAWNTRDLTTTDPDGTVVVFSAGRPPAARDARFTADMGRWGAEHAVE